MKKLLTSLLTLGLVGAVAWGATQAFFSDTETSTGNTFEAGAIDLLVDSTAHYAGMICNEQNVWQDEENDSITPNDDTGSSTRPELLGSACDGTWTSTNLTDHTFFNLSDLKPGDEGENTLSLTVENNDAYMCAIIDNMEDDDNGLTEPEGEAGDVTPGLGEGELSQELHFFAWDDNGNNIWESGEEPLFSNIEGPASDVLDGVVYPLFVPQNGAIPGGETRYVGLYWCYGALSADLNANTLTCDGEPVTNLTQTDSLTADISFYTEQARNNDGFVCDDSLLTPR